MLLFVIDLIHVRGDFLIVLLRQPKMVLTIDASTAVHLLGKLLPGLPSFDVLAKRCEVGEGFALMLELVFSHWIALLGGR